MGSMGETFPSDDIMDSMTRVTLPPSLSSSLTHSLKPSLSLLFNHLHLLHSLSFSRKQPKRDSLRVQHTKPKGLPFLSS